MYFKRGNQVLKENLRELMRARGVTQATVAMACGHGKSWLNKWLNGTRGLDFKDLDKLAEFFGLLPYQLFMPGISPLTERRSGRERRSGQDRRVAHRLRSLAPLSYGAGTYPNERSALSSPPITKDIRALAIHMLDSIDAAAAAGSAAGGDREKPAPRPRRPRHAASSGGRTPKGGT